MAGIPLKLQPPWLEHLARPSRSERLLVVLTRDEVRRILERMHGVPTLMAHLLYGAGLRLLEYARLRIKDIDFDAGHIVVRNGKGEKDRITRLPASLRTVFSTT